MAVSRLPKCLHALGLRRPLVCCATAAGAWEPLLDGPATGSGLGMSSSDYYGGIRSLMPFTQEAPPRPLGIAEMKRFQAARRYAEAAWRRADA